MPDIKLGEILMLVALLAALIGGIFYSGFKYGTYKEQLVGDTRVQNQKTADSTEFNSSNQTGATIGENFQNIVNNGNSDYDNFVQRNTACSTTPSVDQAGRSINGAASQSIVLPNGTRLINTLGYAKLVRQVETQRGQVIGLQQCVRDPRGCKYP